MSYRNPQYKVISQAENYKDMFKSIAGAAKSVADAKVEVAEQKEKRDKAKTKQIQTDNNTWTPLQQKAVADDPIFEKSLEGLNLKFGEYGAMINDGDCGENDPNCSKATLNKARLMELPDQLIEQGASWQEQVDNLLSNSNIDENDPMYNTLEIISKVMGKTPGYEGYTIDATPDFDEEKGEYTGNVTWKFTGPEFENGEFIMNSEELGRLTKGDLDLVSDSPEYWPQSTRINQASGMFKGPPGMNPKDMFNENGTPAQGVTLNKDFQLTGGDGKPISPDSTRRTKKVAYKGADGKTYYREYEYNIIGWDTKKLEATYKPAAKAEADAMMNPANPKDAIAFWNNNFAGTDYIKDMPQEFLDKLEGGVINYKLGMPGAPGNLIYDGNNISEDFKTQFYAAYEKYYYDNTLKSFVDKEVMNPDVLPNATNNCTDGNGGPVACPDTAAAVRQGGDGSLTTIIPVPSNT